MTNTLQVKLLPENARMPKRSHKTDVGYDIFSAETVVLEPQEEAVIKTNVAVSIPKGYVGLLTSRSGVNSKTYLVIEAGRIDVEYHGNSGINIENGAIVSNGYIISGAFDIKGEIDLSDTIRQHGTYQINEGNKLT